MARNVNVWYTNWQRVSLSSSSEFEGDVVIEWIDDNGKRQQYTEKVQAEALLKEMPEEWLMEKYIEMTLRGLRKNLKIDPATIVARRRNP